jgi:hypothetical protein
MPCDCELDLERRWVRCRAWGIVTYEEGIAMRHKFTSDPSFSPDFNQLFDFSDATRLAITASEIGLLARDDVFGSGSSRAMVAPRTDTYGFGRTFHLYRQINAGKERIRIFRTIEEAEAWLAS